MNTTDLLNLSARAVGVTLSTKEVADIASALGRLLSESRRQRQTASGEGASESASIFESAKSVIAPDRARALAAGWRIVHAIRVASLTDGVTLTPELDSAIEL